MNLYFIGWLLQQSLHFHYCDVCAFTGYQCRPVSGNVTSRMKLDFEGHSRLPSCSSRACPGANKADFVRNALRAIMLMRM